jgi:chromosome segregation ATPase
MKDLQQPLLTALVLALCGLCVYQWYGQTVQRKEIRKLEQMVYEKSVAIQDQTNSIRTLDRQVAQMDARLAELKAAVKTNEDLVVTQKRELARWHALADAATNQVAEYKAAVEMLQGKLKTAYDGIEKQNAAVKELVAQRDGLVQKLNDSIKERNEIVDKYNALVRQSQSTNAPAPPR